MIFAVLGAAVWAPHASADVDAAATAHAVPAAPTPLSGVAFVVAALNFERDALSGVTARRGAVDTDAVTGRVMPRAETSSLEHLELQDRNVAASLRRGENRAALGREDLLREPLSWGVFADAQPQGDAQWKCLTEALYFEARGEELPGQVAVAEVILNRVDSPSFPSTVCKVVRQGASSGKLHACQFSYNCDGRPEEIGDRKTWGMLGRIARRMLDGLPRDLTDGATYYHNGQVKPRWARKFERTAQIGDHFFYRRHSTVARN